MEQDYYKERKTTAEGLRAALSRMQPAAHQVKVYWGDEIQAIVPAVMKQIDIRTRPEIDYQFEKHGGFPNAAMFYDATFWKRFINVQRRAAD